jgi:hypothetical protein
VKSLNKALTSWIRRYFAPTEGVAGITAAEAVFSRGLPQLSTPT